MNPNNPQSTPNSYSQSSAGGPQGASSNNSINYATKQQSLGRKIQNFFRNIGVFLILVILVISSLFAYIIIFPSQPFSQFVVNNTPLSKLISLNSSSKSDSTANLEGIKPGNVFFGLEDSNLSSQQSTVKLVSQTLPSVLSIRVSPASSTQLRSTVDGTGIVVSSGGLVISNRHVISLACNTQIPVSISAQDASGHAYELKLLSIDPVDDIAILQITNPGKSISPVIIGSSDDLLLGEDVIAIGNTLGQLNNSVTRGIVSGLDRTLDTVLVDECTNNSVLADGLIQTDAAINKGNSGGPLFDATGQMVGMNTYGTTEAQSVGFALPSSTILYAIKSFNDNGKIIRPRLGVYSQAITPVDKEDLNWLPVDYGEIITSPSGSQAISPGSSAASAGLREGDIILEINKQKVQYSSKDQRPLRKILLQFQPNDSLTLTVRKIKSSNNGIPEYETENTTVTVTLGGVSFDNFVKK